MLTIDTDFPSEILRSPCNNSAYVKYTSGYVLSFAYDFLIQNLELISNTSFIDALALPESKYIGLDT